MQEIREERRENQRRRQTIRKSRRLAEKRREAMLRQQTVGDILLPTPIKGRKSLDRKRGEGERMRERESFS